jgi:hypothetical protein
MTQTVSPNGRARKSLADQIDHLDAILDGLAENLTEAVTAAVASAVREAMPAAIDKAAQAAVREVLMDAAQQKPFGAAQMPATEPAAPVPVELADRARRCWGWLVAAAHDAWDRVTTVAEMVKVGMMEAAHHFIVTGRATVQRVCERAATKPRAGWMRLVVLVALARQLGRRLPVALGVGVAVGVVAYLAGPLLVPVACGLAGFFGSLLVPWEPMDRMTTGPDINC